MALVRKGESVGVRLSDSSKTTDRKQGSQKMLANIGYREAGQMQVY